VFSECLQLKALELRDFQGAAHAMSVQFAHALQQASNFGLAILEPVG
jgi:hypothetical protein